MEFYYQMFGKPKEKTREERRREIFEQILNEEMSLYRNTLNSGAPPISEKTLNELKIHFFKQEDVDKGEKCSICIDNFSKDDQTYILPDCKHRFHAECLKEWFKLRNSCPLCRKEFQTDDIDYESRKVSSKEKGERKKDAISSMYM